MPRRLRRASTPKPPASDPLTAASWSASALAVEPGKAAYIPLAHRYAGAPAQLALESRRSSSSSPGSRTADKPKLAHNAKYHMHVLANHGIALAGVAHDTLLQSYVLESHKSHDMDNLAQPPSAAEDADLSTRCAARASGRSASIRWRSSAPPQYAAEDADITLQLHRAFYPQIEADDKLSIRSIGSIELPVDAGAVGTWSATACCSTAALLEAQSHELGTRMLRDRTAGAAAGRAAVQPEFAASRSRRSCSSSTSCR